MLDLSKPEHREALRWACGLLEAMPRTTLASHRPTDPTPQKALRMAAVDALSSPAESAAIVRALLEGCGVAGVSYVAYTYRGTDRVDIRVPGFLFVYDAQSIPVLILRLLDADSSDEHHARCSKCLQPCTFTPVFPSGFDFQCATHGEVYSATRQQKALAALREVGR